MSYKIGSFNIRDFKKGPSNIDGELVERDFKMIANIIISEEFDIVAIQEVNDKNALIRLKKELNFRKNYFREWEYDYSGKAGIATKDPEGYGFIWNTKRLRMLEFEDKNREKFYRFAGAKSLLRLPYYGRFTARGMNGGSNFELRLVNVHIKDAKSEVDRINEFNTLVKQVLPRICEWHSLPKNMEHMPAYTFMVGDYNLTLDKGDEVDIKILPITQTSYTGKIREYRTVLTEKTSLKRPKEQETIKECYSENYDHFTYDCMLDMKLGLMASRIEPLSKYLKHEYTPSEKLKRYRNRVSDHVPIVMEMDLRKRREIVKKGEMLLCQKN